MKLLKSAVFVSVVLLAAFNVAQQRSTLRGTVTGPEGEPLPGVVVRISSPVLMRSMEVMTNDRGIYVLPNLPPGVYRVELMLEGFNRRVFEHVEVRHNAVNELNVGFATQVFVSPQLVLDTALESLPQGKIEQNIPTEMTQGVTERIEVRISKDLKTELLQNLRGRGIPVEQTLAVSTVMKVILQGDQDFFRIDPLSSEEQIVAEADFTEWEWDVTPLASGEGSLRLLAIAVLAVEGAGEKNKDLISLDETIAVEINVPWIVATFVGEYWQWIIGTIIAIIGVILAYLKFVYPILSKKRNNADAVDN
ncbi:MAG TPA: carboxypeptidase-like regulatory domain-containing protein [Acidobacteriota bacterium]|nr:carboxypeptidase-like regulatory domain-containing protein [Acidobacteriota bacterium]